MSGFDDACLKGIERLANERIGFEIFRRGGRLLHRRFRLGRRLDHRSGGGRSLFLVFKVRHLDRGDVRALAITDSRRSPLAPDIPTMAELNMPEFTTTVFAGFIAPAGTPDAIREKLARELGTISRRPEIIQRIGAAGATVTATTPEEMRLRAERERPYWAELVRISGARLD